MPQMGVSVSEGTIADWKKRVGDWVERDETILEISTDKIETEIPSPAAGRVAEILVDVGVTVPVGEVLARLDTGSKPGQPHADEHPPEPESKPANGANGQDHAPPVSPVVRRIAAEHHIDLEQLHGTGMRGRVTKKDVLAFVKEWENKERPEPVLHMESPYREDPAPAPAAAPQPAAPAPVATPQPAVASGGEPLSLMRKKIGEHMRHSLDTAAHCTTI